MLLKDSGNTISEEWLEGLVGCVVKESKFIKEFDIKRLKSNFIRQAFLDLINVREESIEMLPVTSKGTPKGVFQCSNTSPPPVKDLLLEKKLDATDTKKDFINSIEGKKLILEQEASLSDLINVEQTSSFIQKILHEDSQAGLAVVDVFVAIKKVKNKLDFLININDDVSMKIKDLDVEAATLKIDFRKLTANLNSMFDKFRGAAKEANLHSNECNKGFKSDHRKLDYKTEDDDKLNREKVSFKELKMKEKQTSNSATEIERALEEVSSSKPKDELTLSIYQSRAAEKVSETSERKSTIFMRFESPENFVAALIIAFLGHNNYIYGDAGPTVETNQSPRETFKSETLNVMETENIGDQLSIEGSSKICQEIQNVSENHKICPTGEHEETTGKVSKACIDEEKEASEDDSVFEEALSDLRKELQETRSDTCLGDVPQSKNMKNVSTLTVDCGLEPSWIEKFTEDIKSKLKNLKTNFKNQINMFETKRNFQKSIENMELDFNANSLVGIIDVTCKMFNDSEHQWSDNECADLDYLLEFEPVSDILEEKLSQVQTAIHNSSQSGKNKIVILKNEKTTSEKSDLKSQSSCDMIISFESKLNEKNKQNLQTKFAELLKNTPPTTGNNKLDCRMKAEKRNWEKTGKRTSANEATILEIPKLTIFLTEPEQNPMMFNDGFEDATKVKNDCRDFSENTISKGAARVWKTSTAMVFLENIAKVNIFLTQCLVHFVLRFEFRKEQKSHREVPNLRMAIDLIHEIEKNVGRVELNNAILNLFDLEFELRKHLQNKMSNEKQIPISVETSIQKFFSAVDFWPEEKQECSKEKMCEFFTLLTSVENAVEESGISVEKIDLPNVPRTSSELCKVFRIFSRKAKDFHKEMEVFSPTKAADVVSESVVDLEDLRNTDDDEIKANKIAQMKNILLEKHIKNEDRKVFQAAKEEAIRRADRIERDLDRIDRLDRENEEIMTFIEIFLQKIIRRSTELITIKKTLKVLSLKLQELYLKALDKKEKAKTRKEIKSKEVRPRSNGGHQADQRKDITLFHSKLSCPSVKDNSLTKNAFENLFCIIKDFRRIGENSLYMAWSKPTGTLSNFVIGYEISINGKLNHKVRNPQRTQAILYSVDLSKKVEIHLHGLIENASKITLAIVTHYDSATQAPIPLCSCTSTPDV